MRTGSRLSGREIAEAALLADVAVVLLVAGYLLTFISGPLQALAAIPFAVLGLRHRRRVLATAALVAGTLTFLTIGLSGPLLVLTMAPIGLVLATAVHRQWSRRRYVLVGGLLTWLAVAVPDLVFATVLTRLRRLALETVESAWAGLRRLLGWIGLHILQGPGDAAVRFLTERWYVALPIFHIGFAITCLVVAMLVSLPALRRLQATPGLTLSGPAPTEGRPPGPLPVRCSQLTVTHAGAVEPALREVDLEIDRATFTAVVGQNGSGKSTLVAVLAGQLEPSSGSVTRPGSIGLGEPGGTAVISQRPESQVLGVRVRDDLVWGLSAADAVQVDVAGLLASVGLAGFADREAAELSGGELQRLAIAAALSRRPALLLSDESTSMLDPDARTAVLELLAGLPQRLGLAVVHVTHRRAEAELADRVLLLDAGRVLADGRPSEVLDLVGTPGA